MQAQRPTLNHRNLGRQGELAACTEPSRPVPPRGAPPSGGPGGGPTQTGMAPASGGACSPGVLTGSGADSAWLTVGAGSGAGPVALAILAFRGERWVRTVPTSGGLPGSTGLAVLAGNKAGSALLTATMVEEPRSAWLTGLAGSETASAVPTVLAESDAGCPGLAAAAAGSLLRWLASSRLAMRSTSETGTVRSSSCMDQNGHVRNCQPEKTHLLMAYCTQQELTLYAMHLKTAARLNQMHPIAHEQCAANRAGQLPAQLNFCKTTRIAWLM